MQRKWIINCLSVMIGLIVFFTFQSCFSSLFGSGISGKNVVNLKAEDSRVYFSMKCPDCGYVDLARLSHNMEKGETWDNTVLCLECGRKYPISITKK